MAYFHTTVLDEQIKALPTVDTASGSVASFDTDMTENLVSVIAEISASATKCYLANMSDITNKIYFEGLLNGTYGFVDLGTLNWIKVTNTSLTAGMYFYATMSDRMVGSTNMICSNYFVPDIKGLSNIIAEYGADVDNILFTTATTSRANIVDSDYTDENDLTAALNGVYLIYELATPTTPTITKAQFETLLNAFGLSGWLFEYDFGETVSSGATLECVSGTLTRNDDSIKSIGGNILSVLSDNNIFANTGDTEVNFLLTVGNKIS